IGVAANATTSIGLNALASDTMAISIGTNSTASGTSSVALGPNAQATNAAAWPPSASDVLPVAFAALPTAVAAAFVA
ncbi:hypothetical protein DN564_30980, partial [Burkholderia multivorans]